MGSTKIVLTDAQLETLAERCAAHVAEHLAELLGERGLPARSGLVDAATLADALGTSRDFVYAHAAELGAKRIGNGSRGRLRFDLDRARAAWTSSYASKESQPAKAPTTAGPSQRRGEAAAQWLPIRAPETPLFGDEGR